MPVTAPGALLGAAFVPAAASVRAATGDAALVLMAGGLAMILTVTLLALLQSLGPARTRRLGSPGTGRELRPMDGHPPVPAPGSRTTARAGTPYATPSIDRAMDAVVARGLGEPRLLRLLPRQSQLRLYRCRGCDGIHAGGGDGCQREAQALADVMRDLHRRRVVVRETACRLRGDDHCEFEVAH